MKTYPSTVVRANSNPKRRLPPHTLRVFDGDTWQTRTSDPASAHRSTVAAQLAKFRELLNHDRTLTAEDLR